MKMVLDGCYFRCNYINYFRVGSCESALFDWRNIMIIEYIKMRLFYAKLKKELFRAFSHADEVIKFVTNFSIAYKDSTVDMINKDFMHELAGFVHEQAEKDRSKKKD